MYYVVGSGPSGVAAASALVDAGADVTMLDAGEECEPERVALARRVAATPPDSWKPSDVEALRGSSFFADDARMKRSFGSTFAYALDDMRTIAQNGTRCLSSHARGGLSNVWGAAVLPARDADLADWPIDAAALTPHYAAVASLLPIAAAADDFVDRFPLHAAPAAPLQPSRQAQRILDRTRAQRARLAASGIAVGQSRLAVKSAADDSGPGCQYVGLCLSGCPYFAIWHAGRTLDALRQARGFAYTPGIVVHRVESRAGQGVRVRGLANGAEQVWEGKRVLLACGPIATARIVIDSLHAHGHSFKLQYQPYFLLPLIAAERVDDVERERLHTLAQIFVEVVDEDVSPWTVHLQLYTYNPLVAERLDGMTRWFGPLGARMRAGVASRVVAVQGYLHSREADAIRLTASSDPHGSRSRLTLDAPPTARAAATIGRVVAKIARHRRDLGARPIGPLLEVGRPGDGNHVGGTFPMRRHPGSFETDLTGQLADLAGVHLVDSSSLPSLPATTVTYVTMANAHRIATAVAALD